MTREWALHLDVCVTVVARQPCAETILLIYSTILEAVLFTLVTLCLSAASVLFNLYYVIYICYYIILLLYYLY